MTGRNWGVVGGGLLGATLALRLAQAGERVTVYESAPGLGGLASAWDLDGIVWDRHYHVVLLSDAHLRGLLGELGLDGQIRWVTTRTGCYADGHLYSVSNAVELLRFPPLRLLDRLRLGATVLYAARLREWRRLEGRGVEEWLGRLSGRRTFQKFWRPLLRSKLGDDYSTASAAFIWAIIQRLYAARRTGLKREMFGYVPGGYASVLEALARRLEQAGVQVRTGRPVEAVGVEGSPFVRYGQDGDHFDEVVVTVAAPLAARLVVGLPPAEQAAWAGVRYQGIVCASLLLNRPLSPYYVTNITDDGFPFTGVIEMTALVDPARLGGRHLVYLPCYVPSDDPLFALPDDALRARLLAGLRRMHPDLADREVLAFRVSRERYVFPVPTLHYSRRLPSPDTSLPGVHIVNSAQIVNGTLNVNETVQLAEAAAARLLAASATSEIPA